MGEHGGPLLVGNTFIDEGAAIYDTETGSVLWVVCIGDASVVLEPAGRYEDELLLSTGEFISRVAGGRFEFESPPPGVAP